MTDSNVSDSDTCSLFLPPGAKVPRRNVLKLGALGLGGLAIGGTVLSACGDDDDAEATSEAKERIKAHWVYIGPPDDNGWTQEHDRGRKAAQAALGDRLESAFTPNVGFDASTSQLFQRLADDGNDIVFINTEYAGLLRGCADRRSVGAPAVSVVEEFADDEDGGGQAQRGVAVGAAAVGVAA